mgnify:CR=1 FL=1
MISTYEKHNKKMNKIYIKGSGVNPKEQDHSILMDYLWSLLCVVLSLSVWASWISNGKPIGRYFFIPIILLFCIYMYVFFTRNTDSTYGNETSTSESTFQLNPKVYQYTLGILAASLFVVVATSVVDPGPTSTQAVRKGPADFVLG